jgi:glycerol kinase
MKDFILAVDAGTTSSRAIIFDRNGDTIGTSQHEFTQHFPKESWVEHDALEIWDTQLLAIREVLEKTNTKASQIHAIGITNQRETTVLWNRSTGKPVHKAIVWQDRRTAFICDELKKSGKASVFYEKTGLLLDAYFSGTKIKWILDQDPVLKKQALKWDKELLDILDIPVALLPEVVSSSEKVGVTSFNLFGHEILISGIAGDQQAALFGQMCIHPGDVKNTYGTGCFCIMNTGEKPVQSKNKMLTTIGYQLNGKVTYALEGSVFIAGAVVQWLRDQMGIISSAPEIEVLAKTVENNGGVTFIPALSGLGAPYWDPHATGTILGITRGTQKGHIARAALEAIAMRTREIIIEMQKDANTTFVSLKVDGGGSTNDLLMQIQSNLLQTKVIRPKTTETTALGAAFFAGLASGYWPSLESLASIWKIDKKFNPVQEIENQKIIESWQKRIVQVTNTNKNE